MVADLSTGRDIPSKRAIERLWLDYKTNFCLVAPRIGANSFSYSDDIYTIEKTNSTY